jgi:DEAD/DEAH box helicase domain-containing protein
MLPLQQAFEVKESILEFIRTTYEFKDDDVQKAFYEFIEDPRHGLIKGPYISLKAPFLGAEEGTEIPLDISPGFPPYRHQVEAFRKLTTKDGHHPQNTLITTGTGSGKTECFLYPILDYCYKHIGEKGIKVIILYPMNALATDQAKRLAETIYGDARLKDKVTAGLFIGKGTDKTVFRQVMDQDGIIENRDTIVSNPPDILLTNFKMLDYGLMRSENAGLWKYNTENPGLLQFLVLDELHTYDGAQGTDVANLIRRLKLRLGLDKGMLCGIGTSATIGSGEESKQLLCDYASDIFGEEFSPDDVIEEHRVPLNALFSGEGDNYFPRKRSMDRLTMDQNESHDAYIDRQLDLWDCSDVKIISDKNKKTLAIADALSSLQITRDIFSVCESTGIIHCDDLLQELRKKNKNFNDFDEKYQIEILESLLALISEAKRQSGKILIPYLPLQVQLWVRELSGIRRVVSPVPKFSWNSDVQVGDSNEIALPMYYCRECGASGWIATKPETSNKFDKDGGKAAQAFMQRSKELWYINTKSPSHKPDEGFEIIEDKLKMSTLDIVPHLEMTDDMMEFYACRKIENSTSGKNRSTHHCPECFTDANDLSIVGARSATLASLSVSQLLSSNLDSTDDRGRKVLTFTNSVQDAAHLSGFYMSREYRFIIRASIQKVIELMEKEGKAVTLATVYHNFIGYWKKETGTLDAYVHRFFPSDYMGEINLEKDFRKSDGSFRDDFIDEFDLRLFWEIVAEFGLNTSFGRTLERTGSSATYFRREDIDRVYELMKPWIDKYMRGLASQDKFEHFLIGFLERTLVHGGISHPFLELYRNDFKWYDLNWCYKPGHFLNHRFSQRERLPHPFVVYKTTRSLPADNAYTQKDTWYYRYFMTCFPSASPNVNISNDFYAELAEKLTDAGIFDKVEGKDGPNYCISPDKVYVSSHVRMIRCSTCQKMLITSEDDDLSLGTHCIVNKCDGLYNKTKPVTGGYYQRIYRREKTPRIYSHEHTGLLGRAEREEIELDFKTRPKPDSLNSLVATSTLEMGIDIGDLNSELNVSIPPLTSNYLQRAGRAGRKSGSALILDFAKSDPHDLFFFEDPQEMMSGMVNTPGCYLNAKDILRRHFYAFCIDSWTAQDPASHTIPATIFALKPQNDFLSSPDFFINRISLFIRKNLNALESSFSRHYSNETYNQVLIPMFRQFSDGSFEKQVEIVFFRMRQEYLNLTDKIHDIFKDISARKLAKTDDEYKELMTQKSMLHRQRTAIRKRQVLEFMTDEGLLPNYAFPETGVKMSASILGNVPKGEAAGKQADIKEFELVRSASAGLKDFAPGNHFYFDGMKLTVNGINTSDWNTDYGLVRRRFCSRCDCIKLDDPSLPSTCPKCGDPSFGSAANVHTFVDLRSVKVDEKVVDTVLNDSAEERESESYRTSIHFEFAANPTATSYGMKNIPFGIEYVKGVKILEANLGESHCTHSNEVTIKDTKVPRHGFITCRYCGKSVATPGLVPADPAEQRKAYHYPYCKHKDKLYEGKTDDIFEEVFLSREMQTEAIKILLPVQQIDSDATMAMFKAGLNLGLKKYFKGNPSHISLREYCEYNRSNEKFDSYVIMYDTIPGGTGYLSKLFEPAEFTKVLKLAYEALDQCSCQFDGKDGCYHCVLSYENKYTRGQLSRRKAAELFKRIVDQSDRWETITGSLGSVTRGGSIEESELETRFITSLRYVADDRGWTFECISGVGANYYELTTVVKGGEIRVYTITPQVQLGPSKGVEYTTIPDFYLECIDRTKDGVAMDKNEIPHIALYLDGYTFHGSAADGKIRFFDDFKKRESIHRSGRIITWTMTWEDIDNFHNKKEDTLFIPAKERNALFWNNSKNVWKGCVNDYERFLKVISEMGDDRYQGNTLVYLLSWTEKGRMFKNAEDYLDFKTPETPETPTTDKSGAFAIPRAARNATWAETRLAVVPSLELLYSIRIKGETSNLDKETWNHFWRLYNMLNLSKSDMYVPVANSTSQLGDILEYYDPAIEDMVTLLFEKGIDFDYENEFCLKDDYGEIIADADLGVESIKTVINPHGQEDKFSAAGYTVIHTGEIDKLKEIIG